MKGEGDVRSGGKEMILPVVDIQSKIFTIRGNSVFFEGQVFDAYSLVSKIIRSAARTIIIVDNYIDETILTLLIKRKKTVYVDIYTKNISPQMALDIRKHNEQYPGINIKI